MLVDTIQSDQMSVHDWFENGVYGFQRWVKGPEEGGGVPHDNDNRQP